MSRTIKFILLMGLILSLALSLPPTRTLILATTTSTQDSGLLDVLVPMFEEQTGYTVQTVAVGSGEALKMGEEGNADVLLVHAPASEVTFMEGGFGKTASSSCTMTSSSLAPPKTPLASKA
jgi:tungstate transport system substrate-binding protein